jgi:hypothetical protein
MWGITSTFRTPTVKRGLLVIRTYWKRYWNKDLSSKEKERDDARKLNKRIPCVTNRENQVATRNTYSNGIKTAKTTYWQKNVHGHREHT